jgi:hypothetical protein
MIRSMSFLIAALFAGSAAAASTYSATLATPASGRQIGRDHYGDGAGANSRGSNHESGPHVLCHSLAKRAGRVDAFLVDGRAVAAADLERCNASAKVAPTASASGK